MQEIKEHNTSPPHDLLAGEQLLKNGPPALIPGKRTIRWVVASVIWSFSLVAGWLMLVGYSNSPGESAQPPLKWPSNSQIALNERTTTLVLFAHPHCPCTRATLGELEKIVAQSRKDVTPWVVFFKAAGSAQNWEQTDLWKTASAIPGVRIVSDRDGEEARRFHVATSGQTLLYSRTGELLFSGGITWARGHSGDNAGRAAIEACLTDRLPAGHQTPVFGCPIVSKLERR